MQRLFPGPETHVLTPATAYFTGTMNKYINLKEKKCFVPDLATLISICSTQAGFQQQSCSLLLVS